MRPSQPADACSTGRATDCGSHHALQSFTCLLCRPVKKKKANAQALQNVLKDLDKYKERKRRFEGSKAAQAAVPIETPAELEAVFDQDTAAEEPAPVPEPPVHGQCVLPVQVHTTDTDSLCCGFSCTGPDGVDCRWQRCSWTSQTA